jgi:enoyl-CoA hydratase/carnithine racemase
MIRTDTAGRLRVVTLDRPDRRNALRPADLDALEAAVTEADDDPDVAVVYLTGAGPAFCAGADLDTVAGLDDPAAFAAQGQWVARTIESADVVVVAGVDGAARGGGVELALACDVRVAGPDATFAEPGVQFGLFGAWGGTVRLSRVVGEGDAMDLALSGRVVDAETALRMGLVSRVTDHPRRVAEEIAANEPDALAAVKRLLRTGGTTEERETAEQAAFADLVAEHADAIGASREKGE